VNRTYILGSPENRQHAHSAIDSAPVGYAATIGEPNRTLEQNSAQWPILDCFAKQKMWPVNGELVYMTDEEWKDVLTAGFKKEMLRLAQGIDGGVVMLGQRTSKFGKSEFSNWLDYLNATAAFYGIDLSAELPAFDEVAR